MIARPKHCAACGADLEQPHKGRPRRFCNDACRKRYDRARASTISVPPPAATPLFLDSAPAPAEERLAATIETQQIVLVALRSVAPELPPQLEWRARGLSDEVSTALNRYFEVNNADTET